MAAPNSVTDSSRLSDLAPKVREDEIPDSVSLFSQRHFAELQATPGSHAPGVMVNGGRLKRVQGEVPAGGLGVSPVPRTPWNPPLTKGDGWQDRCSRMLPGFGVSPRFPFSPSPKNGGQGVDCRLFWTRRWRIPRPWRSMALQGPFWIPAPRFHKDKLRGNDRRRGPQRDKSS
jgi:hypothetical protein